MDYVIVAVASVLVGGLTLFSGFGLGSLLLPVFALFFPLEVAVGATAVVHLANNLFKLGLVGRHAVGRVVVAFGLPAAIAAFLGAFLLTYFRDAGTVATYDLAGRSAEVTWLGLVIGVLIVLFSLLDLIPFLDKLQIPRSLLPVGGTLSGLFGGISGHQGALRSAFLIQLGLSKEAFIGSGVACAVLVDVTRLGVYGSVALREDVGRLQDPEALGLLLTAILAAFLGSFAGSRLMHKVTLQGVRRLVGALLLVLGVAIGAGLV